MRELMFAVETNSALFELIKKAKTNKTWAWILGNLGSALVGLSIRQDLALGVKSRTIAGIDKGRHYHKESLGMTTQNFKKLTIPLRQM